MERGKCLTRSQAGKADSAELVLDENLMLLACVGLACAGHSLLKQMYKVPRKFSRRPSLTASRLGLCTHNHVKWY